MSVKIEINEKELFKSKLKNDLIKSICKVQEAKSKLDGIERRLVKLAFPEFYWMYHEITYTWKCKASPVGYCTYDYTVDPARDNCIFCHEPEERK